MSTPNMVAVVAPANLEAGYTFPAQIDGMSFTVTVPEGGVKEGQQFHVPHPNSTTTDTATAVAMSSGGGGALAPPTKTHNNTTTNLLGAPNGRWRNNLCECCEVCCCTAMCCNAWCCVGLVVGQLAQRFKLSFLGTKDEFGSSAATGGVGSDRNYSTFNTWAIIWAVYILLVVCGVGGALEIFMALFVAFVIMNIRYAMRKHYNIPPSCCSCCDGKLDDFCCGCCCSCCVTIQMARHTHDHNQYPYQCCAPRGLPSDTPDCV